ncbi:hypothetical protein QE450_002204 [Paenibacillus sp. SORGH_AS306]|uniref:hypothetical protein n=1 Tax=unclassified Paenibacillus TaxID=185978 RepID=UPI00278083A2|nr:MULTISPECIES: hypothetical protein [unclassified Paenibacillus]MDQ1234706.1 hypothetical protein [Paenibacillus sp. SORGH_AS_0306]MDR6111751.1 hypothetical protein [Paenibacillus sp. SORGH_AS_0338]
MKIKGWGVIQILAFRGVALRGENRYCRRLLQINPLNDCFTGRIRLQRRALRSFRTIFSSPLVQVDKHNVE